MNTPEDQQADAVTERPKTDQQCCTKAPPRWVQRLVRPAVCYIMELAAIVLALALLHLASLTDGWWHVVSQGIAVGLGFAIWRIVKEYSIKGIRREAIAALEHEQWAGWIKYMFSKCSADGESLVIPPWAVARWARQAMTPYEYLSDAEKLSDLIEADRVMALDSVSWPNNTTQQRGQ